MQNTETSQQILMRRATLMSLVVAGSLIIIKGAAWGYSDSLSLLASLFDSIFDVASSLINFMAVRYALMPPDEEHRFGHGKAEDIAALAQSTFIAGSGLFILIEGIKRMVDPEPITHETLGMAVMVVSMILTAFLVGYQKYVTRQTGSIVVSTDSLHYVTDLMTGGGVILALILSGSMGITLADPIIALAISAYIFHGAWQIGFRAFHNLMDHEFPEEDRAKILAICKSHPKVLDVHDLKTRRSGIYSFIQCHMVFDDHLSLLEAHAAADEIEEKIKQAYANSEVLIHQDPKSAV